MQNLRNMDAATTAHDTLILLLKKKGVGPTMSKSLSTNDLDNLRGLFFDPTLPLATKATLLTAILFLPATPEEGVWIKNFLQHPSDYVPQELCVLASTICTENIFESLIKLILSGAVLSEQSCLSAMDYLWNQEVPAYLKAAFLEGLRLRRETDLENHLFLNSIQSKIHPHTLDLPLIVDISNPYDGFNRTPYLSHYTATLLASMGIPCVLHGIDEISPKRGVNTYKLLSEAKKNPLQSIKKTIQDILNPDIGWGYIDQSLLCPELYALKSVRVEMIKRPFLATLEKLLVPLRAKKTYVVTSFTHPPYRKTMTHLLQSQSHICASLLLRGVEGSTQLALDRKTPYVVLSPQAISEGFASPQDFGINGQSTRDIVIYHASVIVSKLGILSSQDAFEKSCFHWDNGDYYRHWKKGCCEKT